MARRVFHSFVLFIIIIGQILASRYIPRARGYRCVGDCPGCPDYCGCAITDSALYIQDCIKDPGNVLDDIILGNRNVTYLQLRACRLSRLPTAVCRLRRLYLLSVPDNQLLDLPWACLHKIHTLRRIWAPYNRFSILRNDVLYGFRNLQRLDMSRCRVTEIEEDVFTDVSRLPRLTHVDLSHNYIESVDPWAMMFEHPISMVFNNNRISRFTNRPGWVYNCAMGRRPGRMELQHNKISHMMDIWLGWKFTESSARCFYGDFGLSSLDIRNNDLNCDCRDVSIYRILRAPVLGALRCASPPKLRGRIIGEIDLSEFVCHVHDGCPRGCDCISPDWMNMTVRCSVRCPEDGLETLPNGLPSRPKQNYRYHLFLQQNIITSLEYRPYLKFVATLVVSGNKLRGLSVDALKTLENIDRLYLDGNKLERLPDQISKVNMNSVTEMRFQDNMWRCDCHGLQTKRWLVQHQGVISDWRNIHCTYPYRLKGEAMLTLPDDLFICGDPPNKLTITKDKLNIAKDKLTITFSIVGTFSACVVFLILPVIIYTKRVWIYKTFKWHPMDWDECQDENSEFDIFVSYANEDEEFVGDYLIPVLISHGFKVCFHKIHFLPGTPIHTNIEHAVYNSKRTLLFLSNFFSNSDYCMWEFNVALDRDLEGRTRRLVVIKDTDLDVGRLDKTLQTYLHRMTYVERESEYLWDNLLYALPINRLGNPRAQNGAMTMLDLLNDAIQLDRPENHQERHEDTAF